MSLPRESPHNVPNNNYNAALLKSSISFADRTFRLPVHQMTPGVCQIRRERVHRREVCPLYVSHYRSYSLQLLTC